MEFELYNESCTTHPKSLCGPGELCSQDFVWQGHSLCTKRRNSWCTSRPDGGSVTLFQSNWTSALLFPWLFPPSLPPVPSLACLQWSQQCRGETCQPLRSSHQGRTERRREKDWESFLEAHAEPWMWCGSSWHLLLELMKQQALKPMREQWKKMKKKYFLKIWEKQRHEKKQTE